MSDVATGPGFARRVARALVITGVGSASARVLGLGALLLALGFVTPSELGLASLVLAITAVLRAVAEVSLGVALVQAPAPTPAQIDALFWLSVLAALAAMGGIWLVAPGLAGLFGGPGLVAPLRAQSAVLVIGALGMVSRATLERTLRMGRLAIADNVGTVVGAVALVVLAWRGAGVWAFVGSELVTRTTQTAGAWLASPYRPRGTGRGSSVGPLVRFGLYASGSRLLFHLYINADYLVVGAVLSEEVLGLYAFAYRLVLDPTRGITNVIVRVAYPAFARLQDDPERLSWFLEAFARLATGVIGVFLVVGVVEIDRLLIAADYARWLPALPLVWIFAGVALLHTVTPLLPQLLNAVGRVRDSFLCSAVSAIAMPIAFVLGAYGGGALGVAWAWLLGYPIVASLTVVLSARALQRSPWSLLRSLAKGSWVLLPLAALGGVVRWWLPAVDGLALEVAVGGGLAAVGLTVVLWRMRDALTLLRGS